VHCHQPSPCSNHNVLRENLFPTKLQAPRFRRHSSPQRAMGSTCVSAARAAAAASTAPRSRRTPAHAVAAARVHRHRSSVAAASAAAPASPAPAPAPASSYASDGVVEVFTFDLDDTLWPTTPVVQRANQAFVDFCQTRIPGFPDCDGINDYMLVRRPRIT